MVKWVHPIVTTHLVVEGGMSRKPVSLATKDVQVTVHETEQFARLDKNADWLLKLVLGNLCKGGLRRTQLIETLRFKVDSVDQSAAVAAGTKPSAVAGAAGAGSAVADPMDALDRIEHVAVIVKPPPKNRKRRICDQIVDIEMPELEPTSNPTCENTRTVRLLPEGSKRLWIAVANIPWLLTWLRDECRSCGVPQLDGAPVQLVPNTSVEGVHIRWSFDGAWEAIVLSGPKQGFTTKSFVANMTEEKWLQCPQWRDRPFDASSAADRRAAAHAFLELHMATVVADAMRAVAAKTSTSVAAP